MHYILFGYTTYPIHKSCKEIARDKNPEKLKNLTKEKGNKFFINHSTGGGRFQKSIDGEWLKLNGQI